MYKCKHFKIKELVHPDFLKKYSEDLLWTLFDERLLKAADMLRDRYGAITCNGNGLTDCGLRLPNSEIGANMSAHKFGRALDLHIMTIENMKGRDNKREEYNSLRTMLLTYDDFSFLNFEKNVKWLHIDTFNRPFRTFNP